MAQTSLNCVLELMPPLFAEGVAWEYFLSPWSLALFLLGAVVALCFLFPGFLIRWMIRILAWCIYRVCASGLGHIPQKGGALLVCNHVSYIDWMLLILAQPRPIRFLAWAGWTKKPFLGQLLHWAKVIPIDGNSGPRAVVQALRQASDAIANGELVCIFAEGRFTRNGMMLPFYRGFEQILKHCKAPIIPVSLDQVWGSIFSLSGGKAFWKWPLHWPYCVSVSFGQPLPPETRAGDVRQAIQLLSAASSIARTDTRLPIHRQFVRVVAQAPVPSMPIRRHGASRRADLREVSCRGLVFGEPAKATVS